MASSSESALRITTTGPKISVWWIFMPGLTSVNTVGPRKWPFSQPGTTCSRPSRARVAPSSTPVWIMSRMNCLALAEMTGPITIGSSATAGVRAGWPRARFFEASTNRWLTSRYIASPTQTMAEEAMHRWPAQP